MEWLARSWNNPRKKRELARDPGRANLFFFYLICEKKLDCLVIERGGISGHNGASAFSFLAVKGFFGDEQCMVARVGFFYFNRACLERGGEGVLKFLEFRLVDGLLGLLRWKWEIVQFLILREKNKNSSAKLLGAIGRCLNSFSNIWGFNID